MGIEPTQDLLGPTLVLKTRSATRRQSPPQDSQATRLRQPLILSHFLPEAKKLYRSVKCEVSRTKKSWA
jgi:hypothetical protein